MNVTLYNFSKRRNSTAQPTGGTSYTCVLKEGTSTSRPDIMIKWDGSTSPVANNYAHIGAFNRYYWINSWTYEDRCWIASCSVDVLATYKSAIGSSTKYVLRAYSAFDAYAPDNKYPVLEPPTISNWACTGLAWAKSFDGGRFVIGVVGNGNTFNVGGVGYYVLDSAGLQSLITACFTQSLAIWTASTSLGPTIGEALQKYGENLEKSLANPVQFINSICWVPFTPSTSGTDTIKLGNVNTGVTGAKLSDPVYTQSFTCSVNQWNSGTYAWPNLEPFIRYVLHVPPFPDIEVPAELLLPSTLSLLGTGSITGTVRTDVTNGLSILTVDNGNAGAGLLSASAQLGIPVNLAGSSVDYAGQIKAAASAVQSGISAFINPAGAIAGVTSGIVGFAEASQPKAKTGGYSGGMAALSSYYYEGSLIQYIYPMPDLAGDEVGYPLLKNKTINTLSGYVLCADGEVACNATQNEHAELEAFLTGGFFYE